MKLVCINIEHNTHTERVMGFLKQENPDVVCLQELLEEDLDAYKKELGYSTVYQPWYYILPSNDKALAGKKHGIAIFAKNILKSDSLFFHGQKENITRPFAEYLSDEKYQSNSALVWADIESEAGDIYRCITTHLPVTYKGEVTPHQLEVIDALLSRLDDLGEFVLRGDTNAPRGREAFERIASKYKDNIPKKYTTSIDQNLHQVKGIQFMVDGLFTTPDYQASNVRLVDGVSDHQAIIAEISKKTDAQSASD